MTTKTTMSRKPVASRHSVARANEGRSGNGGSGDAAAPAAARAPLPPRERERGYALVALLALMTILALALTAAAPSIHQQKQRDLEREAIARGEEVAEAIAAYFRARQTLPTSMDQLLEGIPFGTKKIQILRPSATIDPLSTAGEWRLVRPRSADMTSFQQAIMLYSGGTIPPPRDPVAQRLFQQFGTPILGAVGIGKTEDAPGGEDDSTNASGPFIGVASRSRRDSVVLYYGIERHDKWVFTPLYR